MTYTGIHFDWPVLIFGFLGILFIVLNMAHGIACLPAAFRINPKIGLSIVVLSVPLLLSIGFDFSNLLNKMGYIAFAAIGAGLFLIWADKQDPINGTDWFHPLFAGLVLLFVLILTGRI